MAQRTLAKRLQYMYRDKASLAFLFCRSLLENVEHFLGLAGTMLRKQQPSIGERFVLGHRTRSFLHVAERSRGRGGVPLAQLKLRRHHGHEAPSPLTVRPVGHLPRA